MSSVDDTVIEIDNTLDLLHDKPKTSAEDQAMPPRMYTLLWNDWQTKPLFGILRINAVSSIDHSMYRTYKAIPSLPEGVVDLECNDNSLL